MIRSMLKTRIQRVRDDFHSHPRAFWLAPALTAFGLAVTGTGVSANQQTPSQPVQTTPPQAQETHTGTPNIQTQSAASNVSPQLSSDQDRPYHEFTTEVRTVMAHGLDRNFNPVQHPVRIMLTAKKPSSGASKASSGASQTSSAFSWPAEVHAAGSPGTEVHGRVGVWHLHDLQNVYIHGKHYAAYCNGWDQQGPGAGATYKKIGTPPASQQKALVYAYKHHFSHDVQDLICWIDSTEGHGEDPEIRYNLVNFGVPAKDLSDAHQAISKSGSVSLSGWTFATYADRSNPGAHQQLTVVSHGGGGKNNTNTTGGGGTTSSSTSTSTSGSCGGGAAAAAAGGGAGGPAAGGAAAGGDAAGGAAAGGAATVAGAGGGTNGTAGGVVGGGEGNNDSDPYGPNNNNVISGHGTDDNNNNPVNNNVVPEVPLVNNNDHEVNNIAENKQFDHESKDIAGVIDTMNATPTHAYQLAKLVNSDKNDSLNQQEADYQENNDLQYSLAAQNAGLANQADVQAIYQSGRAELQSLKDQHAEMDLQSMAAASNSADGLEQTSEDSGQNDPLASFKQTLDQLNVNGQNSVSSQNLTNGLPEFQQTYQMTNNAAHSQLKLAPQRVSHQSRLVSGVNVKTDDIAGIAFAFGMLLIALAVADEKYRRKYRDG